MKLDNCLSILNIYRKDVLPCSFIKIFVIKVSAFLKNNFIKMGGGGGGGGGANHIKVY